jgi:hypothetical protein
MLISPFGGAPQSDLWGKFSVSLGEINTAIGLDHERNPPSLDLSHSNGGAHGSMRYFLALLLAATNAFGARETIQDAALHARQLLHGESVMTLTSIFDPDVNPTLAGQPFAYGACVR